ncbi:helix-turn-helix domain-containing protein [Jongsikchunia kroppenstedtii]|uniref:helix-turn-helix domain-containing protein n=1 Tax=Jongsikchunia kroppenstedtii TaxID=1121721 RepID=UPI00035CF248|nr:helix-turn-helix transcriptional regulator [Jongsikchunia kroppenstedtii]
MKLDDARWAQKNPGKLPGKHVRQLRLDAGVTLEAFAKEARRCGLQWQTGRVSDLESGKVDAKLDTLARVAQVLANLLDRPVTVEEVLGGGHPWVQMLRDGVTPDRRDEATPTDVARRNGWPDLASAATELGVPEGHVVPLLLAYEDTGLVDKRAARELGMSVRELTVQSYRLWGRNFTQERDRRAGEGAHAAALGDATRAMRAEIEMQEV